MGSANEGETGMDVRAMLRELGSVTWRALRRVGLAGALAALLLSGLLAQLGQAGMGLVPTAQAAATHGHTTVYNPSTDQGGKAIYLPGQVHQVTTLPPAANIQRPTGSTMKAMHLALNPLLDAHGVGSDGRLEVTVPSGAMAADVMTSAGGPVSLLVTQIAGPSGGTDSGHVFLGTYQFTLMGPHGQVAAGLAKPIHLALHLDGWRGAAFDLSHAMLIINGGALPATLDPSAGQLPTTRQPSSVQATLNNSTSTLTADMPLASSSGGSSTGTWNTNSPDAHWSKQTDTSVDLPSGDLTYSYPLDLPPGPGGLAPKLQLTYDSAAVAGNHNPQGTSGWLGQGWDLSVGSISWGEHNYTATCTLATCSCPNFSCATWQNSWQFSDAYGYGGELLPKDTNISAWYDDTTNPAPTTRALLWYLSTEKHVKIISYTNPTAIFPTQFYPTQPPCFRAWLPNGVMEEYGCTVDSLQWYVVDNSSSMNFKTRFVYRWDLDMIVDPNGNQIHFHYLQRENFDKSTNDKFPIDATLDAITYDSPGCHNTTSMCTGSSWQPAVQIQFQTDYAVLRSTGASCPTWTLNNYYNTGQTMRCDDVQDLSHASPAGTAAPNLQSLAVLNDILVQVTTTPSAPSWHTLRDYQLSYDQTPSTQTYNGATIVDPATGLHESAAGALNLTQILEVGNNGTTSLPPLSMTYTSPMDEYYIDTYFTPSPASNCGPAWNVRTGCPLWTQTYNARYLSALDNGRGWHETNTWSLARNNSHGVDSGLGLENPLACDAGLANNTAGTTCKKADDENWSRFVLSQRQASVGCVTASGSGCGPNGTTTLTSTWSYAYTLTDVTAKQCTDCTESMYWGDQSDGDKLDFYNAHFMGFHSVNVTNPDGALQVFTYNSTNGYGKALSTMGCFAFSGECDVSPWTLPANALHQKLKEVDDYDTNAATLLKQTLLSYNVTCPPVGVPGSPSNTDNTKTFVGQLTSEQDPYNPMVMCEITTHTQDVYMNDGGGALSGSHTTTTNSYTYDTGGHVTVSSTDTTASNPGITPHIVSATQNVFHDAITTTSTSASGTYITEVPAIQTTEDGAGHVKACAYSGYDGGTPGATGSQSSLTKGLLTRTDRYSASCTSGSLSGQVSTLQAYDNSGNLLATKDADAMAGVAGHTDATDCTISSVAYSACATWDTLYSALPTKVVNALGQKTVLNYVTDGTTTNSPDATNGWGQRITTSTDPNGQVTAFGYDALGRLTATAKPGDSLTSPTVSYSYGVTCPTTGASTPCVTLGTTQNVGGGASRYMLVFYDGWGRQTFSGTLFNSVSGGNLCGLRQGTSNYTQYAAQFTLYDPSGRLASTSAPYFTAPVGCIIFPTHPLYPDTTQPQATSVYDGLGRTTQAKDALGNTTNATYTQAQPQGANVTDTATYEATTVTDAKGHRNIALGDGFGRTRYTEAFIGNASPYTLYGVSRTDYDWLGNVTAVTGPNPPPGAAGLSTTTQTTITYDLLGRKLQVNDADLGQWNYQQYDQDGNLVQYSDPRGAGGTVYAGYDGLDRQLWRNTSNSASGAYVTYSYDSIASGNVGIGRLTGEAFAGGPNRSLTGSYAYTYDVRGQQTHVTQSVGGTAYPVAASYNDAGQLTTQTYPNGDMVSNSYTAQDWLAQVTRTSTGTTTSVLGGDTNAESTSDGVAPNNADAYEFTATSSGTANQLSLYLDATSTATAVQVGVYSNDSSSGQNHPGTLLTSATITAPAAGAWNQVTLSGAALTAGQTYWIALMDPTGGSGLVDDITSNTSSSSTSESDSNVGSSLPTTWTTTAQWGGLTLSAYVSQVGTGPSTTTLLGNVGYSGVGGAIGQVTSANIGGGTYAYGASYDALGRITDSKVTRSSDNTLLFESTPVYDAAGNVKTVSTTVPQGTDNQAFCYDEQNRLTWAGSTGTAPCGNSPTPGTLASAQYTQSFSYDTLNRLTSGPLGSYTYGNSAHVHAATAIGSGSTTYTATYDAAGNMICRAPTYATTCSGTQTGAQLSYDNQGELSHWQSSPSAPSTTDDFLYDGAGTRIEQRSVLGATTTTTVYVGTLEEIATTGSATTTTAYYYAGGMRIALAANGILSYLGSDNLGSVDVALSGSGSPQADQLFAPYGSVRYSQGTMPTSKAFTGQYSDVGVTGLQYFHARYYDPTLGQFGSADTVLAGGLNRYAYVGGNPESATDPSGNLTCGQAKWANFIVGFFLFVFSCGSEQGAKDYLSSMRPLLPDQRPVAGQVSVESQGSFSLPPTEDSANFITVTDSVFEGNVGVGLIGDMNSGGSNVNGTGVEDTPTQIAVEIDGVSMPVGGDGGDGASGAGGGNPARGSAPGQSGTSPGNNSTSPGSNDAENGGDNPDLQRLQEINANDIATGTGTDLTNSADDGGSTDSGGGCPECGGSGVDTGTDGVDIGLAGAGDGVMGGGDSLLYE